MESGGGIDKLAGSAWASVVLGSDWRAFAATGTAEDEDRLCEAVPVCCGGFDRAALVVVTGSWEGGNEGAPSVDKSAPE